MDNLGLTGFAREPLVGFFVFQLCRLFSFLESLTPPEDAVLMVERTFGSLLHHHRMEGNRALRCRGNRQDFDSFFSSRFRSEHSLFWLCRKLRTGVRRNSSIPSSRNRISERKNLDLLGDGCVRSPIVDEFWRSGIPPRARISCIHGVRRGEAAETGAAVFISGIIFIAILFVSGYSSSFFRKSLTMPAPIFFLSAARPENIRHIVYFR